MSVRGIFARNVVFDAILVISTTQSCSTEAIGISRSLGLSPCQSSGPNHVIQRPSDWDLRLMRGKSAECLESSIVAKHVPKTKLLYQALKRMVSGSVSTEKTHCACQKWILWEGKRHLFCLCVCICDVQTQGDLIMTLDVILSSDEHPDSSCY